MKLSTKSGAVGSALAVAGTMLFAGAVQADTVGFGKVSALHEGYSYNPEEDYGRSILRRQALSDPSEEFAGVLVSDGGPTTDGTFYGFCIESNEAPVEDHVYNVVDLSSAPNDDYGNVPNGMGSEREKDLMTLFSNVYPDFSSDDPTGTGKKLLNREFFYSLQIAAWEISTDNTLTYELDTGEYQNKSQYAAQADEWLTKLNDDEAGWTDPTFTNFIALVDTAHADGGHGQDFIGQVVVPIPAAAWLFGSALIGTAALGRRKLQKKPTA